MEVNFGDDGAGSYPSLFATHLPFQIDASLGFVVALPVAARDLAVWDVTRDRFVNEPGCYRLLAGRSSRDVPLSADVDVHGEPVPPRTALGDGVRAVDFDDADGIQIPERTREKGAAVQVPRAPPRDGSSSAVSTHPPQGDGTAGARSRSNPAQPGIGSQPASSTFGSC